MSFHNFTKTYFGDPFNPKTAIPRRSFSSSRFTDLKKSLKQLFLNPFSPKKAPPRSYACFSSLHLLDQSLIEAELGVEYEPPVVNIGVQRWEFKEGEWITESHILARAEQLHETHVQLKEINISLLHKGEILLDQLSETTLEHNLMTKGEVEVQHMKKPLFTKSVRPKTPSHSRYSSLSSLFELNQFERETEVGLECEHPVLNIGGEIWTFEGQWRTECHRELQLERRNAQLNEDNNLLKLKLEILIDMLTDAALKYNLTGVEEVVNMKIRKKPLSRKSVRPKSPSHH